MESRLEIIRDGQVIYSNNFLLSGIYDGEDESKYFPERVDDQNTLIAKVGGLLIMLLLADDHEITCAAINDALDNTVFRIIEKIKQDSLDNPN